VTAPGIDMPTPEEVIPAELMDEFAMIEPLIGGGPGKGLWVGPSMSQDIVSVLQDAYSELINDPDLVDDLAEAIAGGEEDGDSSIEYVVDPLSGDKSQASFDAAVAEVEKSADFIKELQAQYWDDDWS
jgi:hypothetical protein